MTDQRTTEQLLALLRFQRLDKHNCDEEGMVRLMAEAAAELELRSYAAKKLAVLALQGNDYHRGSEDFRDAVDDVLEIMRDIVL